MVSTYIDNRVNRDLLIMSHLETPKSHLETSKSHLENPTPNCNYILSKRLMFGYYPGQPGLDGLFDNAIDKLLEVGCDVFVNTVPALEKKGLYDYVPYVKEHKSKSIFIDYPIEDGDVPVNTKSFQELICRIHDLYKEGRTIYVHCAGGHGRSAVIVGCLLINMGFLAEDVIFQLGKCHRTRDHYPLFPCPHTKEQREFIRTYSSELICLNSLKFF